MYARNRLVYLAGAIDNVDATASQTWRTLAATVFARHGYGCFSPAHAYFGLEKSLHAESVDRINRTALANCQLVMAFINDSFTIGSVREIEMARQFRMPVYLYTPQKGLLTALQKSMMTYDLIVCEDVLLNGAVDMIIRNENERSKDGRHTINLVQMPEAESEESGS
jgi:hypothetical protein